MSVTLGYIPFSSYEDIEFYTCFVELQTYNIAYQELVTNLATKNAI